MLLPPSRLSKRLIDFSSLFFAALFLFSSLELLASSDPECCRTQSPRYVVGISPKLRFVWFRNAKVATTTIKSVFREHHVEMPIMSEDFKFSRSRYKNYFKFGVVRNPWARVVSCYCQKVENKNPKWAHYYGECFDKGFDYFIGFIKGKDLTVADRHIRLQTCLVPLQEVDFVGRLENFEDDFGYILGVIGVINKEIPKKNPSVHEHYSKYYTEKTKQIVGDLYACDIEAFGYEFEQR